MNWKSVSDSRKYRTQFIFLALKLLFNEAERNFVFKVFFWDFSLYVGRYDFLSIEKFVTQGNFMFLNETAYIFLMYWLWNFLDQIVSEIEIIVLVMC